MDQHWTDESLLEYLYLNPHREPEHHCDACAERWSALVHRRAHVLAQPELPLPPAYCLETASRAPRGRLAIATASLVIVAALGLLTPKPAPEPTDAEVVADAMRTADSLSPAPIMRIQGLFEENR